MTDPYTLYYQRQATGNYVGNYQVASQKGDGIGSFLGGLMRRVFPLLTSGFKAVGKEGLATSVNLMRDALNGRTFKESVHNRFSEAGKNLTEKLATKASSMVGSGYKKRKHKALPQSYSSNKKRRLTTNCRSKSDIFGEY